jgi:hypothetical protein
MGQSFGFVMNNLDALPKRDDTAVEDLNKNGQISYDYIGFLKKLSFAIGHQRVRNYQDYLLL